MTARERTQAVVSVGGKPRTYDLTDRDELSIGRRDGDVVLLDGSVSPKHARLVRHDDVWHVEDLGSVNGTFVANAKIAPHQLVALGKGAVVRIGDALVRIETVAAQAETSSEPPERRESRLSALGPFIVYIVIAVIGAAATAVYSCNARHEAHDGHGQEHKR